MCWTSTANSNLKRRRNIEKWDDIITHLSIDIKQPLTSISPSIIRQISGIDARLMAKMDTIEGLPKIFKDNNLFLIPLSAKEYVIVRGNGYHKLEPIDKKAIIHYTDKPFPISAANSKGETAYLDYSYSSGLLERVIGTAKLDRGFHGKRRTTTFKFYINSLQIIVSNAQIEVDESYETKKEIIIFEAKKGIPSSFSIRQLYYPYRTFINIKSTRLFLFSFDKKEKEYLFWEYEFDPYDRFESITLVNASKYKIRLKAKKISVKPYLNVVPIGSKIDIPQADDINKVLLFPLKVSEGYNTSAKIEELFGFVRRQSNYYRQVCFMTALKYIMMSSKVYFQI